MFPAREKRRAGAWEQNLVIGASNETRNHEITPRSGHHLFVITCRAAAEDLGRKVAINGANFPEGKPHSFGQMIVREREKRSR